MEVGQHNMDALENNLDDSSEDLERWSGVPLVHVCEVCGKTEILTPEEAFRAGWDYPPRMGRFGVVSPRTCGSCTMTQTAWWALVGEHKDANDLTNNQRNAIARILNEPSSILPPHFPGAVISRTSR